MLPAEKALLRFIRQTLYMLKRQYGGTVDLYKMVSSGTDPKTGDVVTVKEVVRVDRAVVLPVRINRQLGRTVSRIVTKGISGAYDAGRRLFIVDRSDAPDLEWTNDDWLVYRGRKYEVEEFQEFEFEAGWLITGRELAGQLPEQIHRLRADTLLGLQSGTEAP